MRPFGRQILDKEYRTALIILLSGQAHCEAITMSILEVAVDPAVARYVDGKFTSRQHDLSIVPVNPITINVDIAERVVGADLLELAKGLAQWPMVPDPDVANRRLVLLYLRRVERALGRVRSHVDPVQTICRSS